MKKSIVVILIIVLAAVVGIGGIYLVKPELITNLFNNSSVNEPDTPAIPDLSNAVVVTDTKITDRVKYEVGTLLSGEKINNPTFSNSMGYAFITYGTIDKDTLKISDESKRVIALNGALESRSLMTEEVATKMKKN